MTDTKDLIIGIDAGTSVIKSIAFDLDGNLIDSASIKNEYHLLDGGGAEQDQALTWQSTAKTLKLLADKIPDLSSRAAAVSVTGQGDGTWLIDKTGAPVHNGLLWLDARAADIAELKTAEPQNKQRFASTGTGLNGCQQGAQLVWLKQNKPDVIKKAATALHCKDWLYYNLTGELATDPSEGNFTFGDFRTRDYDDDVIEFMGLTQQRHLLPPIVDGTMQAHTLTAEAAKRTGLLAGTPMVLGYVDVMCTALGGGLYDPDCDPGCTIIGSTGMHMKLVRGAENVVLNDDCTGYTMCMPVPGVYSQMQSNMAATLNIDWLLDAAIDLLRRCGIEKKRHDLLPLLDDWVDSAKPASVLYQPYISEAGERGPFIDASARAGFIGLSVNHDFGDMTRAVFEGLSYAAKDCYAAMGGAPAEVRITGGAARSKQLVKILSSSLGSDIRTSDVAEAGATGAAMMAAVSIGHYQSMDDCARQWVVPHLGDITRPDPTLAAKYESLFPAYQQSRQSLGGSWKAMNQHRLNHS
jgi:erythritol kinase